MLGGLNRYFSISSATSFRYLAKTSLPKAAFQLTFAPPVATSSLSSDAFKGRYSRGPGEQGSYRTSALAGAAILGIGLVTQDSAHCEGEYAIKRNLTKLIEEEKYDAVENTIQKMPKGPEKDAMIEFICRKYTKLGDSYWFMFAKVKLFARLLPLFSEIEDESKKNQRLKDFALYFQKVGEMGYILKDEEMDYVLEAVNRMTQGKDDVLELTALREYSHGNRKNVGARIEKMENSEKRTSLVKTLINRHRWTDESTQSADFIAQIVESVDPSEKDDLIHKIASFSLKASNLKFAARFTAKIADSEKRVAMLSEIISKSSEEKDILDILDGLQGVAPSASKDVCLVMVCTFIKRLKERVEEEYSEGVEEEYSEGVKEEYARFMMNGVAQFSTEDSLEKEVFLDELLSAADKCSDHDLPGYFMKLSLLSKKADSPRKNELFEIAFNGLKACLIEAFLEDGANLEGIDEMSGFINHAVEWVGVRDLSTLLLLGKSIKSDPLIRRHFMLQEAAGLLPGARKDEILEKIIEKYCKGDEKRVLEAAGLMSQETKKDLVYQKLAESLIKKGDLDKAFDRAKLMSKGPQRDVVLLKIINHAENGGSVYTVIEAADELFSVKARQEIMDKMSSDL